MYFRLIAAHFILFLAAVVQHAGAQETTVSPLVLYSDKNEITVTDPDGIRSIATVASDLVTVEGAGEAGCAKSRTLDVFVNTASEPVVLNLAILDCKGNRRDVSLQLAIVWRLDVVNLGSTHEGTEVCERFSVRAMGSAPIILDDITVDDPHVTLHLPTSLPIEVAGFDTYVYTVCHDASDVGIDKFPVVTWIRRDFPSAGETSYPVADTGIVRVFPPLYDSLTDPTTFRSVGIPNAVVPRKGTLYLGNYDLLGLTAGYSFDDHFMVIAGGGLPTPDDWGGTKGEVFGAWSIGVKVGLHPTPMLHVAAGFQYGRSIYDVASTAERESQITINAPYGAVSWGDDDRRVSLTVGYAFKKHATLTPAFPSGMVVREYDRNAAFVGLGGDWRIGRHWKLVGEAAFMETAGVVPIVAGLRYFGRTWAVDAGVGYVGIVEAGASRPKVPLVPALSGIVVFGR